MSKRYKMMTAAALIALMLSTGCATAGPGAKAVDKEACRAMPDQAEDGLIRAYDNTENKPGKANVVLNEKLTRCGGDVVDDGLPPDPGEAGKETVAGIDSDNDGVRDDVQRWIVLTYPDEPNTQQALFQMAVAMQKSALGSFDKAMAEKNFSSIEDGTGCVWFLKSFSSISIISSLSDLHLNTESRARTESMIMGLLGGSTAKGVSISKESCKFLLNN